MYGNQATAIGGANIGSYPDQAPKSIPQVSQRLEELARNTEQLHTIISELENRLQGILRPSAPTPTGNAVGEAPAPSAAPLAVGIRELSSRVQVAGLRISDLIQRTEI